LGRIKGKRCCESCRQILNSIRLVDVSEQAEQEARVITSGTNKIHIRTLDHVRLDKLMKIKRGSLKIYTNEGLEKI
jgi:hypothetical protein